MQPTGAGSRIVVVAHPEKHNDPDADRLWRRCRNNPDLRWLVEGVLTSRKPELGRVLLLSPVEFLGEAQARIGNKLSLLFHLTGFPYLSESLKDLAESLRRMMSRQVDEPEQSRDAKKAMADWAAANGRHAQDLIAAAILDTVRRNPAMQSLTNSNHPVTPAAVAQTIPNYELLDWKAMEELVQLFEPFLARSASKKPINRFTLNFTALMRYFQPEISQLDVVVKSAQHFVGLLQKRGVTESAWRDLLLGLIDRELVAPYTSMFLWCPKVPEDGFFSSASLSFGPLPPFCPWCDREAHAMAAFAPDGPMSDAMRLKDGLLGAAVGWYLKKARIRFWHALCIKGTEIDFVAEIGNGYLLIECKMFSIAATAKRLARTVRDSLKQLDAHSTLLQGEGWNLRGSMCVVNLTEADLHALRGSGFPISTDVNRLVSYERFSKRLRAHVRTSAMRRPDARQGRQPG